MNNSISEFTNSILGKKVNFIDLSNYLIDLDARNVTSHLHVDYSTIINNKQEKPNEKPYYIWISRSNGLVEFQEEELRRAIENEISRVTNISFSHSPGKHHDVFEVLLTFDDYNEVSFEIDSQGKYIQLLEFILNYKSPA